MADYTSPITTSPISLDPVERAKLRQAMLQKYQQANDMSDVQAAQDNASTQNTIAGIGQGLATIGNSAGVAAGGPQIGGAGFDAQRQSARDALKTAYDAQQARSNQALTGIQMQQGFDKEDQDLALAANGQALTAQNQAQHDKEFNQSQNQAAKFHNDEMAKSQQMLQAEIGAGKFDTTGQKDQDAAFAKDNVDWTKGGQEKANKAIDRLTEAQGRLSQDVASGKTISGNFVGRLPESMQPKEGREIQSIVKEAAYQGLKETFGGRISDAEIRIQAGNWYDPTLDEQQNLNKLNANIESLKKDTAKKNDMSQFFGQNRGSLKNYGQQPTQAAQPSADDIAAKAWLDANPNDPAAPAISAHLKSVGM